MRLSWRDPSRADDRRRITLASNELGGEAILDARYLLVNRLARKCIIGLSIRVRSVGERPYLISATVRNQKKLSCGRIFWLFDGN